MARWIYMQVERALAVDRGVNTILCTRHNGYGEEIVVRMSDEAIEKLRRELDLNLTQQNGEKT